MTQFTPGPYDVRPSENPRRSCLVVSAVDGKSIASVNFPGMPNIPNAQLLAKSWELLAMLRRVRETCYLSFDPAIESDIDVLIAEASTEEVPPTEEEQDEEDG